MCTIILDETREAREMTELEAQQRVDSLIDYDNALSGEFDKEQLAMIFKPEPQEPEQPVIALKKIKNKGPNATQKSYSDFMNFLRDSALPPLKRDPECYFTEKELASLFERCSWGQVHGWYSYTALTDSERKIVDKLGLTPKQKPLPEGFSENSERIHLQKLVCEKTVIDGIVPTTEFYTAKCNNIFFIGFDDTLYTPAYAAEVRQLKEAADLNPYNQSAVLLVKILKSSHIAFEKSKLNSAQIANLEEECKKTAATFPPEQLEITPGLSKKEQYELSKATEKWEYYMLLTDNEKKMLEELKLTPVKPQHYTHKDTKSDQSAELRKRFAAKFKSRYIKSPTRGINANGDIYVWLNNCCYGDIPDNAEYYFVRFQDNFYSGFTTAYKSPELIVDKRKLRPDQVEYMDKKCAETRDYEMKKAELEKQQEKN